MNLSEVKEKIYDITAMFFNGATIIWAEQGNVKPDLPYITLKTGPLKRNVFFLEDDNGNRYYNCEVSVEINLYTKGMKTVLGDKKTAVYENTATSDLIDFFNFLDSEGGLELLYNDDISISLFGNIRDLSDLQNDTNYRFRAFAEMTVTYIDIANGLYGLKDSGIFPNASGGGSKELSDKEVYSVDEIKIEEEK